MRPYLPVLSCMGVAVILAGCTSSQMGPVHPHAPTLDVHLGLFGGPVRLDGHMADSNAPDPHSPIVVTDNTGHTWTTNTGDDGIAAFFVQPGAYTVTSPTCGSGPEHVTVRSTHTAHVQIRCDIP